MKILDCHLFYGATNNGEPYRNCDTAEELFAELSRAGIDGGISYVDTAYPYHGGQS